MWLNGHRNPSEAQNYRVSVRLGAYFSLLMRLISESASRSSEVPSDSCSSQRWAMVGFDNELEFEESFLEGLVPSVCSMSLSILTLL